jgi:predicted nucleic acid-binding protein
VTDPVVGNDRDVATDTSLLLNFLRIDRADILRLLPGFRFRILNHVVNEVTQEPHATRLGIALEQAHVVEFELTDLDAIADYDALRATLGDGEAATIAAAARLGWVVGMDEKGRAKREAVARVGEQNLLNTPGILIHAVRVGLMALDEAEQIRLDLAAHSYQIKSPIGELL